MHLNHAFFTRISVCVALLGFLVVFGGCTIVKRETSTEKQTSKVSDSSSQTGFNAKEYVEKNWDSKTIPELEKGAHELSEVLAALIADQAAAEAKYGKRKAEDLPYGFVVKGTVGVSEVRTTSAAGTALLDLKGPSGNGEVLLQIGPVIKSSAVRDAMTYINFGDFTNQTDFANISREMNIVVRDKVVAPINKDKLAGKKVKILGVLAYEPDGPTLITPVRLTVGN